jgi:hypothetical protein
VHVPIAVQCAIIEEADGEGLEFIGAADVGEEIVEGEPDSGRGIVVVGDAEGEIAEV